MEKKSKLNKILRSSLIFITIISLVLCVPFSVSAADENRTIHVFAIDNTIYKNIQNTSTGFGASYQGSPVEMYFNMNPSFYNLDTPITGTVNSVDISYECNARLKKGYTYTFKLTPGYFYEYVTPYIQMWVTLSDGNVLTFQQGSGPEYNGQNMCYFESEYVYDAVDSVNVVEVAFSFHFFEGSSAGGYVLCCGSPLLATYELSDTDKIIENNNSNTDKILNEGLDQIPSTDDYNKINDYDASEKDLLESSKEGINLIDSLMSGGSLVAFLADAGPTFGLISDFFLGFSFLPFIEILLCASLLLGVLPAILNIAESLSRKSSKNNKKKKKNGG